MCEGQGVVGSVDDDVIGMRKPVEDELTDLGEPRPAVGPADVSLASRTPEATVLNVQPRALHLGDL